MDRMRRPARVKLRNIHFKGGRHAEKEERNAVIIAVFGSKGGVGKTTIAVNLATALSQMGKRTALLDFDLQFGDASIFLDLDNKQESVSWFRKIHYKGTHSKLFAASNRAFLCFLLRSAGICGNGPKQPWRKHHRRNCQI